MNVLNLNNKKVPVKVPVNVPVNILNKLSKTEEKVLNVISNNKYVTRENIANELSLSVKTIARAINNLKDMNIINRIGSDKKGSWEIKK